MNKKFNAEEIYRVVESLIGKTEPTGSHSSDRLRIKNLDVKMELANMLNNDIHFLGEHREDYRESVKEFGEESDKFLEGLKEMLEYD